MSTLIPVILAGGQGTRLWPASLHNMPKQFLSIDEKTLMHRAIKRALAVTDMDVIIVTNESYLPLFPTQLSLPLEDASRIRLIGEPTGRNTAPAIALALRYIEHAYPKEEIILLIITADHLIEPLDAFVQDLILARAYAEKNSIVTFGIIPTRAETGYGYIEYISSTKSHGGYKVRAFHEKPNKERAYHYIKQGNFMWNSGMFCFCAQRMRTELYRQAPSIAEKLLTPHIRWKMDFLHDMQHLIPQNIDYTTVEKKSIDYAVMEAAENVIAIPASFSWNDVGSWDEVSQLQETQKELVYLADARNVSVFTEVPVGVCGLSDIVVVVKNNRVLVMKKGCGQLVKIIAEEDEQNI